MVSTEIDVVHNLVIHHFSGNVGLPDLTKTIENILCNPRFKVGMDAIWDCEKGTKVDVSSNDVQQLSDFARQSFDQEGSSYKLALVANEDLAYGMLRVYEGWSNDRPVTINTFRKFDEALSWMKELQ